MQGALAPDTLKAYVSALASVHVDRGLSTAVFHDSRITRLLAGVARRQPHWETTQAAPITQDVLETLVQPTTTPSQGGTHMDELNMVAAATTAFAGMLRSGEFTWTNAERANSRVFEHTKLLRSDLTFGELDQHAILTLKRSKTDFDHKGVEIILAATNSPTCPVRALRHLIQTDIQPPSAPLFTFYNREFSYQQFVDETRQRLCDAGNKQYNSFTGHSYRRGAATTAKLHGMLDSDIQRLGRWTSESFQRYIDTNFTFRFNLNKRFLTGISTAL
jgi:hypothetical protein